MIQLFEYSNLFFHFCKRNELSDSLDDLMTALYISQIHMATIIDPDHRYTDTVGDPEQ